MLDSVDQVSERPDEPNLDGFVYDVVKSAKYHGCRFFASPGPTRTTDLKAKVILIGKYNLRLDKLRSDWEKCTRGDKSIEKVSSAQYCFEKLLIDPPVLGNKTHDNAKAPSQALREECRREIGRYQGRQQHEYALLENMVESSDWVRPQIAAAYLSPYMRLKSCSVRHIRRLVTQEILDRNSNFTLNPPDRMGGPYAAAIKFHADDLP